MTDPRSWVALVVLVGVAACGSSAPTLDDEATEDAVAEAVTTELDLETVEVACPDGIEPEADDTFTCEVTLDEDRGTLDVAVRQLDDDGALEVDPSAAVLADEELAVQARAALRDSFERSFQVDCGDGPAVVRPPDTTVTCRARDADSRREVIVTVTDADGTLSFEVGDPIAG